MDQCGEFHWNRTNLAAEVEVGDLTWEQKEQVLRELFVRMNTRRSSMTDSTANAYVFCRE